MKIKLYNRDGADLYLEKGSKTFVSNNIYEWHLKVDKKHEYCLQYIRIIGDYPKEIEAVDPSGGPMISLGDEFQGKYKIVNIINSTTFWISERNNDNKKYS